MLYKSLIRPILFKMDAESVHHRAAWMMQRSLFQVGLAANRKMQDPGNEQLSCSVGSLKLRHPIGLAAGFDKNADMVPGLIQCGFSFMEIGTVTGQAQPGNERPRLFRLPADQGLINRMGFNNHGAHQAAKNLEKFRRKELPIPIGGNIGKTKIVPNDQAFEDYEASFKALQPHVDFFVVNVSSPNTPNLRELQEKEPLRQLLRHVQSLQSKNPLPVFLKIAPDLTEGQLEDIAEVSVDCGLEAVIATNTTISRDGLKTASATIEAIGPGGLSGKPVKKKSTEILASLRKLLPKSMGLVGVGGICNGEDVVEKIKAGADCVQVYTGFVYGGPSFVFRLKRELKAIMEREKVHSLEEFRQ